MPPQPVNPPPEKRLNSVDFGRPSVIEFAPGLRFMSLSCLADLLRVSRTFATNLLNLLSVPIIELGRRVYYFRYETLMLALAQVSMPGGPCLAIATPHKDTLRATSYIERRLHRKLSNRNDVQAWCEYWRKPENFEVLLSHLKSSQQVLGVADPENTCVHLTAALHEFLSSLPDQFAHKRPPRHVTHLGTCPFEIQVYRAWGYLNEAVARSHLLDPLNRVRGQNVKGTVGSYSGSAPPTFQPADPGNPEWAGRLASQNILRPHSYRRNPRFRPSGFERPSRSSANRDASSRSRSKDDAREDES